MRVYFEDLKGKVITKIEGDKGGDSIQFTCDNGNIYEMCHAQECCETVYIEDICGDMSLLLNTPILKVEEVINKEEVPEYLNENEYESFTWTFYHFSTIKGSVTIRWFGESNGYYSETVKLYKL